MESNNTLTQGKTMTETQRKVIDWMDERNLGAVVAKGYGWVGRYTARTDEKAAEAVLAAIQRRMQNEG